MHSNHLIADCAQASYLGKTATMQRWHTGWDAKPQEDVWQEWEATQGWDVAPEWAWQEWEHHTGAAASAARWEPTHTAAASVANWVPRTKAAVSVAGGEAVDSGDVINTGVQCKGVG